jgi:hypothetical protein
MTREQWSKLSGLFEVIWKSPDRHDLAMMLAGAFVKEGYRQSDARDVVFQVCSVTQDREVEDRLRAVDDTYKAASLGQPVKAFRDLEAKLPPDTMGYFRELLGVRTTAPTPIAEDDEDPYTIPFRLTERQSFPSHPMLIDRILPSDPRGCVGYLVGLSQSFKSYLAIDWACHVSQGLNWQGNECSQGQVYYVAAEGQYEDLMSRLRAWESESKIRAENVFARLSPVNLASPTAVERAIDRIERKRLKPRLIIFDTLSQCGGDMQENSSDDARRIYRSCKEFATNFGATVLVVAHSGKAEGAIIRGSSAFFDDADCVYQMTRPGWQGGGLDCTLNCRKIKSGRALLNHEMQAREVVWEEGERKGRDLILVQRVLRSRFEEIPQLGGGY